MILGFTGTQKGMTKEQMLTVINLLVHALDVEHGHHGDCIGADNEFHDLLLHYFQHISISVHPPEDQRRACGRVAVGQGRRMHPLPFIVRNRNIVDAADVMLATPEQPVEKLRSGTWATIRYSLIKKKPLLIVTPAGDVIEHNTRSE